ncbi:kielin/chordin-like protein [Pseudophryne corroboree]|uniref:kielin/chordin-like protein n=1 Tax=Pseudophryne corroboree TaxID=495146 RepID=UPI0030814484
MINITSFDCLPRVQHSCKSPVPVYDDNRCCFTYYCPACTTATGIDHPPGSNWTENCQHCTCQNDGTISCYSVTCPELIIAECTLPGYEPSTIIELSDPCCPVSKCFCNPQSCKPPTTCGNGLSPVYSILGCCLSVTCVPKQVCVYNNIDYMPGSILPSPPGSCKECTCTSTYDSATMQNVAACNPITCNVTCAQDEEYKQSPGQCCGYCIKKACYITQPNGQITVLMEGNTWSVPGDFCSSYSCSRQASGDLLTTVTTETCEYNSNNDCGPDQQYQASPNSCCGQCVQVRCVLMTGTAPAIILKENETFAFPDDKCKYYTCVRIGNQLITEMTIQTCEYQSSLDCGYDQEYFPPTDQCCGYCNQTYCVYVTASGDTQLLKEGVTYLSDDKCSYYTCEKIKNELITTEKQQTCQYKSNEDCDFSQEYMPPTDQCCGYCNQTYCVYVTSNGTGSDKKLLKEGEIFRSYDNCTWYTCMKIDNEFITVEYDQDCPYESDMDCEFGQEYVPPINQCCGSCNQTYCVYVTTNETGSEKKLLKEGETYISDDKCTSYTCKDINGEFITVENHQTCLYTSQKDCEIGYEYVPTTDQCCGYCNQTSCVYVTPSGDKEVLKEGEIYLSEDRCTSYTCKNINNTLITVERQQMCLYESELDCAFGQEYLPPIDQCCGFCNQTYCVYLTPSGDKKLLKEGETYTSDDNCTFYTCNNVDNKLTTVEKQQTCQYQSQTDCKLGQIFYVIPGQCCGNCVANSCVYTDSNGVVKTLQANQTMIDVTDVCLSYTCKEINGQLPTIVNTETCEHPSANQCNENEEYIVLPGNCCGHCVQTSCLITLPNGLNKTLKVGEELFPENDTCIMYGCIQVSGQIYTVAKNRTCEDILPEDCESGSIEMDASGCCLICKAPKNCSRSFHDITFKQNDCILDEIVPYCTGYCVNNTMVASLPTSSPGCMCCEKVISHEKTVNLQCADGTSIPYVYDYIDSCGCNSKQCA